METFCHLYPPVICILLTFVSCYHFKLTDIFEIMFGLFI